MDIEIFPLDKVVIDGISICLSMDRAEVETKIGAGKPVRARFYYYENEMAIDYNDNQKVEFIEFLGGIDGNLKPVIYGFSAFDTDAGELFEILKQKNGGEIDDSEHGYSYRFLNTGVGVYRELIPSDVDEMIKEAEADGETIIDQDLEFERRKANHWAAIGIGAVGYYQ